MYTELLKEILKNEINLNVIIDKNNDSGSVYMNNIDKYIEMKSIDIVDNTMEKLKKHLLEMNKDSYCIKECLYASKKIIEKKHYDYVKSTKTKQIVKNYITDIYESKKKDAIDISNTLFEKNINQQGF
jgi:hypothetical protein